MFIIKSYLLCVSRRTDPISVRAGSLAVATAHTKIKPAHGGPRGPDTLK